MFFLGAYVPVTKEGNIIVDGVVASCYAAGPHDLIHIVMAPFLSFPEITQSVFGEDRGFAIYVQMWQNFGRWVLPSGK